MSKWIKCEDRYPGDAPESVIICATMPAMWNGKSFKLPPDYVMNISAWMYLPKPPEPK